MGPEVGRVQARGQIREFTACDKRLWEIHGSGRTRAKQKQGGASNVRATQRDADGSRHALLSRATMLKATLGERGLRGCQNAEGVTQLGMTPRVSLILELVQQLQTLINRDCDSTKQHLLEGRLPRSKLV